MTKENPEVQALFNAELDKALDALDPNDDAHWTKTGLPDLNVLKETMGMRIKRGDHLKIRPGFDREMAGKGQAEGAVPDDTGAGMEGETSPAGRDPIDMFEEMLTATPTQYRRFNPAFNQALQSYESNRPGILEQRERNKARGRA